MNLRSSPHTIVWNKAASSRMWRVQARLTPTWQPGTPHCTPACTVGWFSRLNHIGQSVLTLIQQLRLELSISRKLVSHHASKCYLHSVQAYKYQSCTIEGMPRLNDEMQVSLKASAVGRGFKFLISVYSLIIVEVYIPYWLQWHKNQHV